VHGGGTWSVACRAGSGRSLEPVGSPGPISQSRRSQMEVAGASDRRPDERDKREGPVSKSRWTMREARSGPPAAWRPQALRLRPFEPGLPPPHTCGAGLLRREASLRRLPDNPEGAGQMLRHPPGGADSRPPPGRKWYGGSSRGPPIRQKNPPDLTEKGPGCGLRTPGRAPLPLPG
jgi:hypothetical protein